MCPPPEQVALASAREPLLESEPTSPLSPLSIAPAEAPEDGATIAHIGRDSPAGYWGYWFLGFLVWTSVLCEWNYRLFAEKADRRRGAPRRSVSEVRTPRPFPMPSPSTDDEQGERIEGGAA